MFVYHQQRGFLLILICETSQIFVWRNKAFIFFQKSDIRLFKLFSGTGSVGTVAKKLHWDVVSLDLKGANINCNILEWDYEQYPKLLYPFNAYNL